MDISEGEINESPGINAYGSLIAGELFGEDENIDVLLEENVIDRTLCSCMGQCYRAKGGGACPCKAAKLKCANACGCNKTKCKNKVSLIWQLDYFFERKEKETSLSDKDVVSFLGIIF